MGNSGFLPGGGGGGGGTVILSQVGTDNDVDVKSLPPSLISAGNSTTTPLTGGGTFEGTFVNILDYTSVTVTWQADTTTGVFLVWSDDGVTDVFFEFVGSSQLFFTDTRIAKAQYVRVKASEGTFVAQSTFNLQTVLSIQGNKETRTLSSTNDSVSVVAASALVVATSTPFPTVNLNKTAVDNFTATGNGSLLFDISGFNASFTKFSLQVSEVGGVATSWSVDLEGSSDGVTFTTILTHTKVATGNGKLSFSGAALFPCAYFRSNCTALVLGTATSIDAIPVGVS